MAKLDKLKFLSDVEAPNLVTVPETATVGQTIIVKEVDENGKPTKWEAVEYPLVPNEIIPQTTFTAVLDSTFGCYVKDELSVDNCVKAGEVYTVWFDGVKYTCTGKTANLGGITGVYVGNGVIATGVDTGEPFSFVSADGMIGIAHFGLDGNEHTVRLYNTKLHDGYVPKSAYPYYIEVTGSGTDDDPYVCNDTVANVETIYNSGREICVRVTFFYTSENGIYSVSTQIYHLSGTTKSALTMGTVLGFINVFSLNSGSVDEITPIWLKPQEDGTYVVSNDVAD